VVSQISAQQQFEVIFTLSRNEAAYTLDTATGATQVIHKVMDTANEVAVKSFVSELKEQGIKLSLIICTTGILHQQSISENSDDVVTLKPEKRLGGNK